MDMVECMDVYTFKYIYGNKAIAFSIIGIKILVLFNDYFPVTYKLFCGKWNNFYTFSFVSVDEEKSKIIK